MSPVRLLLAAAALALVVFCVLIATDGGIGGIFVVGGLTVGLGIAALIVHERSKLATWERRQQGRCPKCGYRLSGQTRCPECGESWGEGST